MADIRLVDKHVETAPPKRPKRITGTRFAAILGLNKWNTPFKTWCEITKVYEEPFVDTKFTRAGKIIEPKQAEYMRTAYAFDNLITPTDVWGEDYFTKTFGNFFPEKTIFGGMWDYLLTDANGNVEAVLEMKTTQRAEDWANGEIPPYYQLQAALYAYLLHVDRVIMVCTVLDPKDYEDPDNVILSHDNTFVRPFNVSEAYPNGQFKKYLDAATRWWNQHVLTGISPDYDETADAETLKALCTAHVMPDTPLQDLIAEGEALQAQIEEVEAQLKEPNKRLKAIKETIRERLKESLSPTTDHAEITGGKYVWKLACIQGETVDTDALEADGLFEKYSKPTTTYRMTLKKREGE